jgi:hypothetical protein
MIVAWIERRAFIAIYLPDNLCACSGYSAGEAFSAGTEYCLAYYCDYLN